MVQVSFSAKERTVNEVFTNPNLGTDRFKINEPEKSYTLPAHLYFDPAQYEIEKERIFAKSWIFAGSANQLSQAGSYTTVQVADQNIAVVRGKDGVVRAFHNVCSHRAHELLKGSGRTRMIVCPYHAWSYELDGRLKTNSVIESVEDLNTDEFCLKGVKVEEFLGFLWINLDPDAVPLSVQSAGLDEDVRKYVKDPETLVYAGRLTFEIKANWKNVVENFQDCYHCPTAHPALVELFDHCVYRTKNFGIASSHIAPARIDNSAYSFDPEAAGTQLMYAAWYLWPNVTLNVFPGRRNLSFMHIMPTGPETAFEHWDFYLDTETPNADEVAAMDYIKDVLQPEDIGLVESVQRGLHSRAYSQGRLVIDKERSSNSEHGIHHFQSMVVKALTGKPIYE